MPDFLIHTSNRRKALHLWDGADTLCRMFSTSGMNPDKWETTPIINPEFEHVCKMCQNTQQLRTFRSKYETTGMDH